MRLHFERSLETVFQEDYRTRSLTGVRIGLLVGAILYSAFALLDPLMLPETWRSAHAIRFLIVVPICAAGLGLTFVPRLVRYIQTMVVVFVVSAGTGIVWMIALAREYELAFQYYYAGLILVVIYSFTVVRLQFFPTVFGSFCILAGYEYVAIFDQHLLEGGLSGSRMPVFINNNFFFLAANIVALLGAFLLERYARLDFLQRETIRKDKRTVEAQNVQITEQRNALAMALDELRLAQNHLVQVERTAAIGGLVAGLLHELNSPLGAIAASNDTIERGARRIDEIVSKGARLSESHDENRLRGAVAAMKDSCATTRDAVVRVTTALSALKNFARLDETGVASYDVNAGIKNCLVLLEHELQDRIVVETQLGAVSVLRCHPGEINQVFMSVLRNAVDAIPQTGTITIATRTTGKAVCIEIRDSGVGMSEDALRNIFVPKFNTRGPRVRSGMGLMSCQHIVQRHGGAIDVHSTEGVGTVVTITLPTAPGPSPSESD